MVRNIGNVGDVVEIIKVSIKNGKQSGIPVGKKRTMTLGIPIIVGLPIKKFRSPNNPDDRRLAPATTEVRKIGMTADSEITVETQTSHYHIRWIKYSTKK